MKLNILGENPEQFPPPDDADDEGILAVGGDLSPERLLAAYKRGIFPWYGEGLPILWHCPDPRFVLQPESLHVPTSLKKEMRRAHFDVRYDTAFAEVIEGCAQTKRPGQRGTWITRDMRAAYIRLHELGWAHSAESWVDNQLVGGLYGVAIGSIFFGESMFTRVADASKVAFATLAQKLVAWNFSLIDCQQETEHLARFGAIAWPREMFLSVVREGVKAPTRVGKWTESKTENQAAPVIQTPKK